MSPRPSRGPVTTPRPLASCLMTLTGPGFRPRYNPDPTYRTGPAVPRPGQLPKLENQTSNLTESRLCKQKTVACALVRRRFQSALVANGRPGLGLAGPGELSCGLARCRRPAGTWGQLRSRLDKYMTGGDSPGRYSAAPAARVERHEDWWRDMKTKREEIKRREGMWHCGSQTVLDLPQLLRSDDTGTCRPCARGLEHCHC